MICQLIKALRANIAHDDAPELPQLRRHEQLFVLAYSLGNVLRQLALPNSMAHRLLSALRTKLIKVGAKVVVARQIVKRHDDRGTPHAV